MTYRPTLRAYAALAFSFIAYLTATHGTARALAEFCPAKMSSVHVVANGGGSLYSATLGALSPRSVQADIEAQTENGWYSFAIPSIAITQQEITYKSSTVTFTRNESTSPLFYVRFPSDAGKVLRWWVTDATSAGDTVMGWDAKGKVTCPPLASLTPVIKVGKPGVAAPTQGSDALRARRVTPGRVDYDRTPGPEDVVRNAIAGAPAQDLSCAVPFAQTSVTRAIAPVWPMGYATRVPIEALVRVVVDAKGTLADAWVWQPSGGGAFDDAALASAKASFYAPGTAFCAPAPGDYLFRAIFRPN